MTKLGDLFRQAILLSKFVGSGKYWDRRYQLGGSSGDGSFGKLAEFKAEVLNKFVEDHAVETVIEFGCGDGEQLKLADYRQYLGLDVSGKAVALCSEKFEGDKGKSFLQYDPLATPNLSRFISADLTLSLDVIYHLIEDAIYQKYLTDLFCCSRRYVAVYSSDKDKRTASPHVRHRNFTEHVRKLFPEFRLTQTLENRYPSRSHSLFFFFERTTAKPLGQG